MRIRLILASALMGTLPAYGETDGHGPDAWRVTGVAEEDVLNARTGPGTSYPVIEHFTHDERGMQQIACVPFYPPAYFMTLSETEMADLPPRWCLMRSADMGRAGWVAQQYIRPDDAFATPKTELVGSGDELVLEAQRLVQALYDAADPASEDGTHPLNPANAGDYFSSDVVESMKASPLGADPLYGAQDFEGTISKPLPDPDQPVLRGMITLHVDIVNFGQKQRVTFRLRPDTSLPRSPIRIFRIEHDGWSFPERPSE